VKVHQAQYLDELIDYAGIFPPAALDSIDAANEYGSLIESANSWIVGNIAWSVERLTDFDAFADKGLDWSFAAIGRPATDSNSFTEARKADQLEMDRFLASFPDSDISTYEFKIPHLDLVERATRQFKSLAKTTDVYFELPWEMDISDALATIAGAEIYQVKFRTGGLKKEMYPTSEQLANAIKQAMDLEVPFKLTAGLHEPVAHLESSNGAQSHGFLNVFVAAAVAYHDDASLRQMVEILDVQEESRWKFSPGGVYLDDLHFTSNSLDEVRGMFTSFGSCSVQEPLAGLNRLQVS
jgi:hypothetical protein